MRSPDVIVPLSLYNGDKFIGSDELLLTTGHVLQSELPCLYFVFSGKDNERYTLGIGLVHLLLHLALVREHLCPYTSLAGFADNRKTVGRFLFSKVDEQELCAGDGLLRI